MEHLLHACCCLGAHVAHLVPLNLRNEFYRLCSADEETEAHRPVVEVVKSP